MDLLPFPYILLKLLGLKICRNPFHRVKTPITMALAKGREEKRKGQRLYRQWKEIVGYPLELREESHLLAPLPAPSWEESGSAALNQEGAHTRSCPNTESSQATVSASL